MATRSNTKATTVTRSNKDIALELVQGALQGGALSTALGNNHSKTGQARARVEALYIAELYTATLARLDRLDEAK